MNARSLSRAFSLTEIVIALGILSFALVAIIGLLNVGLRSSNDAHVDTIKAATVRSILSSVRTNQQASYSGETRWYKFDGSTNGGATDAYFECVIATNAPPSAISAQRMVGLRVEFRYPLSAPAQFRTTNVLHASISGTP